MCNRKIPIINSRGEPVILDDDSGVVPPGHGVRVSMMLQDAMQREIAASSRAQIVDGLGNRAGHRPGHAYLSDDDEAPARAAHAEMCKRAENAWRTPAAASVSDGRNTRDVRTLNDADQAYREMVERTANAWKTTGGAPR